jgi:hypothetical protein
MARENNPVCGRAAVVAFALLTAPAVRAAPGDHVRLGNTVITPSVMTGLEYHSNVYLADGDVQPEYGGLSWVLKPDLKLALQNEKVQVDFGLGWGLRKFVDFAPGDAVNLENADSFSNFSSSLGINALTKSLVGLRLDDKFEVLNTPGELPGATSNANVVHISNDANGGIVIRPGSALEVDVLGNFGVDLFTLPEELITNTATYNNRLSYGPVLSGSWKFLPKTSLVGSASVGWTSWQYNLVPTVGSEVEEVDYGECLGKPNAISWRTLWGVRGQFTQKLAASAQLGYGQMYYDEQSVIDDADACGSSGSSAEIDIIGDNTFARDLTSFTEGLLVNAQVAYSPLRNHKLTFGYRKDFQDALFTNYVAFNYLFLRYEGMFVDRLALNAEATYRIDAFHGEVTRDDQNIGIKVGGAWQFTNYLSVGGSGGWNERACLDPACENGIFYPTQYDDFWGQLGVTFTY